jgi:FkbM family methyltransferase
LKTRLKVAVAGVMSRVVVGALALFGRGPIVEVERRGIRWSLDLREGIDFAIWLRGAFEPREVDLLERIVKPGWMVADVGANVGANTLHFARLVGPEGRVVAIEPSDFAAAKLQKNLELNPSLAARVTVVRAYLDAEADASSPPPEVYASWKLQGAGERHDTHCGSRTTTSGATRSSLDAVLEKLAMDRVDFLKLDVDGHECAVLRGASRTLERDRPTMLVELAPQLWVDAGGSAEEFLRLISRDSAVWRHASSLARLEFSADRIHEQIPAGSTVNAFLLTPEADALLFGARQPSS